MSSPPVHNNVILTADVTSLYPSIPIAAGIAAVRHTMVRFNYRIDECDFIIDLLSWILNNNYCIFNDEIYRQLTGTAMGTPCAPTYANIFLYQVESPHLHRTIFYRRYIDDLFAICIDMSTAQAFIDGFNRTHPTIKLEAVSIGPNGIFLDLTFTIEDSILTHRLYQKPSNKYSYIPPSSSHKPSIFRSFIREELRRYLLACSKHEDFIALSELFQQRLLKRGYPPNTVALAMHTLPARAEIVTRLLGPLTRTSKSSHDLKNPIIVLCLPNLVPSPKWSEILELTLLSPS